MDEEKGKKTTSKQKPTAKTRVDEETDTTGNTSTEPIVNIASSAEPIVNMASSAEPIVNIASSAEPIVNIASSAEPPLSPLHLDIPSTPPPAEVQFTTCPQRTNAVIFLDQCNVPRHFVQASNAIPRIDRSDPAPERREELLLKTVEGWIPLDQRRGLPEKKSPMQHLTDEVLCHLHRAKYPTISMSPKKPLYKGPCDCSPFTSFALKHIGLRENYSMFNLFQAPIEEDDDSEDPSDVVLSTGESLVVGSRTMIQQINVTIESIPDSMRRYLSCKKVMHLYSNRTVKPILQFTKPCCGMVALAMASQYYKREPYNACDICQMAKNLNFSNMGELFSARNLARLAELVFDCKATVLEDLFHNQMLIIKHLCKKLPVLVPYDSGDRGVPAFLGGRRAHWALLTGVIFTLFEDECLEIWYRAFAEEGSRRYNIEEIINRSVQIHVLARHGHHADLSAWKLDDLFLSNKCMYVMSDIFNTADLVLPSQESPLSGLRNQIVLLDYSRIQN